MTQPAVDTSPPGDALSSYQALAAQAEKVAVRHSTMADALRNRADTWGKAVAGLGTTAVGYIGLTKSADAFPVAQDFAWAPALISATCLITMAASALYVSRSLQRQTRPIIMLLDLKEMIDCGDISAPNDVDPMRRPTDRECPHHRWANPNDSRKFQNRRSEASIVAEAYFSFGELNANLARPPEVMATDCWRKRLSHALYPGSDESLATATVNSVSKPEVLVFDVEEKWIQSATDSISRYAREAVRLEELAQNNPDDPAVPRELARAAQIRAEVYATQMKAFVVVVRRRVMRVTTGCKTIIALSAFAVALILVSFTTDWSASIHDRRTVELDVLMKCGEATKSLATANIPLLDEKGRSRLPSVCGMPN